MAHRIEDISGIISAGIVVYRRMQETVQTQYGWLHPPGPDEDHVPLHTYYGNAPYSTVTLSPRCTLHKYHGNAPPQKYRGNVCANVYK